MKQTYQTIQSFNQLENSVGKKVNAVNHNVYISHNIFYALNSLPNGKISGWSKLNVHEKRNFLGGRVENTGKKGENAVKHECFHLYPQCFQIASFTGLLKVVEICDCVR